METVLKNYWKRFAGWVIELRDDPFVNARLQLTLLYTVSIVVVFVVAHLVITNERLNPVGIYVALSAGLIFITFAIGGQVLSHIRQIVRAQKRFIADASHELRTPLAIMKTNAEVALIGGDDTDRAELISILKENLAEIDRMSKIIENLLGLSYYDNRYAEIPLMPIELAKIAAQITDRARSLAVKKSIDLQLLNADPGLIRGNPIALEQLAINLIKNSVTYTEPGGKVTVSVNSRDDGFIEFRVKDNGIGIAKEDLKHVLSPFYKSGRGRVQLERESSGLGLTIVKKIVDRHNGSIYINSKLGKGTTVSIAFPRLEPQASS